MHDNTGENRHCIMTYLFGVIDMFNIVIVTLLPILASDYRSILKCDDAELSCFSGSRCEIGDN